MDRYDSYKASGIEWIEEIPEHWEVAPMKRYMKFNNGQDYKEFQADEGYPVMGSGGCFAYATKYLYDGEAVLLGRKGTIDKPLYVNEKFWSVDTMFYATPKKDTFVKYMYYVAKTIPFNRYSTATALPSMTQTDLGNHIVAIPPRTEQVNIADWLDKKCGEIDRVIEKQSKRIELLEELKQSVITHAVTRGLNPDATLKPSGIKWVGDVPDHWRRARIKFMLSHSSAGVWGDDAKGNKDDIACFRVADFNYSLGTVRYDKLTYRNISPKDLQGRLLKNNDLLVEKSGGGDATPVGRVVRFRFDERATCSNFMHFLSVNENNSYNFLFYYFFALYSNRENLLYFNQTTGLQNLKMSEYLGQPLFIPPLVEQLSIADYLDTETAKIDAQIAKVNKEIELLQEYKQSIITEVVTGKRKVC